MSDDSYSVERASKQALRLRVGPKVAALVELFARGQQELGSAWVEREAEQLVCWIASHRGVEDRTEDAWLQVFLTGSCGLACRNFAAPSEPVHACAVATMDQM